MMRMRVDRSSLQEYDCFKLNSRCEARSRLMTKNLKFYENEWFSSNRDTILII